MATCTDCRYFDATAQKPNTPDGESTELCRQPLPIANVLPGQSPWPFCKATDWCSRWTAKSG